MGDLPARLLLNLVDRYLIFLPLLRRRGLLGPGATRARTGRGARQSPCSAGLATRLATTFIFTILLLILVTVVPSGGVFTFASLAARFLRLFLVAVRFVLLLRRDLDLLPGAERAIFALLPNALALCRLLRGLAYLCVTWREGFQIDGAGLSFIGVVDFRILSRYLLLRSLLGIVAS